MISSTKPRLYLIDGSSYIYRAYYGLQQNLSTSKGLPTNAIFGFVNMFLKILNDENPDYLAIAFDTKAPTLRHEEYQDYKAHRPSMPEDLVVQLPYIKKLIEAFNIPSLEKERYEADDLLGTLSKRAEQDGYEVTIVSGDKDMLQLVSEHTRVIDTMKNKVSGIEEVKERFGVEPGRVTEVMGLMGDTSDNIPGVPGIGEKTAISLIQEFGTIENLLQNLEKVSGTKRRENLKEYAEQARMSKRLSTIVTDLPIELQWEEFKVRSPNNEALIALFGELEFSKFLRDLTTQVASDKQLYHLVLDQAAFQELLQQLKESDGFAIDTETTSQDPIEAEIVGISLSLKPYEAFYIPIGHDYEGCPTQLDAQFVLEALRPILEDEQIPKYGQNIKYEMIVFSSIGIKVQGYSFDTMIASYLLNPARRTHNLDEIAMEYLNHRMITYKEVVGTGAKEINFAQVKVEKACDYSCEDADITLRLTQKLAPMLKEERLEKLFYEIELPLVEVLATMEMNGVKVDVDLLREMSKMLEIQLNQSVEKIYAIAGEEFNINSPKQLQEILFEKLKLPPIKKTKTGYSTDVEVLEKLAFQHDLPAEILVFRQISKLKSTYIDALPQLINPKTGRIHTSFNQTVAATGRLSSTNPNLQNIPIRSELGREIRKAFIADPGYTLLSADYSQIELRVLAHIAKDEALTEAFMQGRDIHASTASRLLGISIDQVTPDQRRIAKTVTFGIVYGISDFGLSTRADMSRGEAKEMIDTFFARFPRVNEYIETTLKEAREKGYVYTFMGRRRPVPELRTSRSGYLQAAEREAINTPIQGSAADIIKKAMIEIDREMKQRRLRSKMILQVHDELMFEVAEDEVEAMKELVKEKMEGAAQLSVPLVVDMGVGPTWSEAH
ncbi:MAG: DNA polymerase I [Candidatus Tectomicrobia bacterium]|nr:DNA polymerase I [Candidatus Tectomicrobia bacterium]